MDYQDTLMHLTDNAPVADGCFSSDEIQRLLTVRERYELHLPPDDLGLNLPRLRFARWLVATGELSDDLSDTTG